MAHSWDGVCVGGGGLWPRQVSRDAETRLTGTAWRPRWGGGGESAVCAASFLPLPMLADRGVVADRHSHPRLGADVSLAAPPPAPPARALSLHTPDVAPRLAGLLVECPVLGGIASLLPGLLLLRAAVSVTMKGLRFGFRGCCRSSGLGGLTLNQNGKVTVALSIYTV